MENIYFCDTTLNYNRAIQKENATILNKYTYICTHLYTHIDRQQEKNK